MLGLVYNLAIFLAATTAAGPSLSPVYELEYVAFLNLCYLAGPVLELLVRATSPSREDYSCARGFLFVVGSGLACVLTAILAIGIAA